MSNFEIHPESTPADLIAAEENLILGNQDHTVWVGKRKIELSHAPQWLRKVKTVGAVLLSASAIIGTNELVSNAINHQARNQATQVMPVERSVERQIQVNQQQNFAEQISSQQH